MAKKDSRQNTLGLNDRELDMLLDRLEAGGRKGSPKRSFARWNYRHAGVDVRLSQPSGSTVQTRMACRNISKTGISLLHRCYLHIGTPCEVTIPCASHGNIVVQGRVVRCTHVSGVVHEIGINFDHEIDVRAVVKPDPMLEISAVERPDPTNLVGTILVVEDCQMSLKLIKHFLRDTQLRVRHASTIAEAEAIAREGVSLILCDIHLGGESGGELARRLHEVPGRTPPVVLISADQSTATRTLLRQHGVVGFPAKPFTQDFLLRTITEFMREPDDEAVSCESAWFQADRQIVAALRPELAGAADELDKSAADDPDGVHTVLMKIIAVAPVLGLSDLALQVDTLAQEIRTGLPLSDLSGRIAEISRLCRDAAA